MADHGPATPPSNNGDDDLDGELARLREEITRVRRTRMAIERSTRRRTTVEIAIETAVRDRDAGTTPLLTELRQQGQALSERLQKLWANADWIRSAVARLNAGGFTLDSDPNIPAGRVLIDQLLAEELHRERARQLLDEAGVVTLRVPAVAPMQVAASDNRDRVAAALNEIVQEQAEREARTRTRTQRRARDEGRGPRG